MIEISIIEFAVISLANTMRMYVETYMRFGTLFRLDREEAINNMDRAFEAKLEAFHSLYDVSKMLFPYFEHGDTTSIIAVRNALHHRDHPLFRSLHARLHLDGDPARRLGASFLLASYSTQRGDPIPMSHYVRLDDIEARLDPKLGSPHLDRSVKLDKAARRYMLIEDHLGLAWIRQRGVSERYPKDQIYVDLLPVFTSAVGRAFKALRTVGIAFSGFDADVYARHFTSEVEINLASPTFATTQIHK